MKAEASLYSFRFVFFWNEYPWEPSSSLGQLTPETPVRVDAPYGVFSYRHHAPGRKVRDLLRA